MKTIRWGIAGPGNIARRFAQAVKNVEGAQLVAVASRDPKRGEAFAEDFGIAQIFGSYEAMAASDAVDAVYIATPHPFHAPCAELFLKAGKHVLCEKPMCVNARQAESLKACAEENGVFLMEAMWTRFLPAILEAKKIVDRGDIGEVMGIEADFCYRTVWGVVPRLFQPELAGGGLLDVGVYCLHFASVFLGSQPETITAIAHTEGGVDVHTSMGLKYRNGAIASLSSAIGVTKPETGYIYGTKGHICLPCFYSAQELQVHTGDGVTAMKRPYLGNGFEEEIMEVCRCIREGKLQSDIMSIDETIAILRQMDAVRQQIGIRYPFE